MTDAQDPNPGKKKKAGGADDGLRRMAEWTPSADGTTVSRTLAKANPDELQKDAKRAVSVGCRTGQRFEIAVDGLNLTMRFAATGGKVGEAVRKAARRIAPVTEADRAARVERKTARKAGGAKGAGGKGGGKGGKTAKATKTAAED